MRNFSFRERLHMNNLRAADYTTLRYRDQDRLSRRTAWAISLFLCAAVWTFVGLGLWSWLSS